MLRTYRLEDGRLADAGTDGPIRVYASPTEAEIAELTGPIGISRHDVDSALDPDELGRFEVEDDYIVVIVRRPKSYVAADQFQFRVMSMGIFLAGEKLVVVLPEDVPLPERRTGVRLSGTTGVLLRLLSEVVGHFMGHLKVINMMSESLERKLQKTMENRYLVEMFSLSKSLVYFLSATTDNGRVLLKLKGAAPKLKFSEEEIDLLEDLVIDNQQCLNLTRTYSEVLSGLMEARAALVGNNLNLMMKNMNAIVIAIAVPSFLAGVGGMSEFTTMTGARWWVAYPLFVAAMVALGAGTFWLIRRWEKGWS